MIQSYVTFDEVVNNQVTKREYTLGTSTNEHTLLPNDAVSLQMKNLQHLSDQNANFGGNRTVITENALKDLYVYLNGTKFIETINTAVA